MKSKLRDCLIIALSAAAFIQAWLIHKDAGRYAQGVRDGIYSTILYVIDDDQNNTEIALR